MSLWNYKILNSAINFARSVENAVKRMQLGIPKQEEPITSGFAFKAALFGTLFSLMTTGALTILHTAGPAFLTLTDYLPVMPLTAKLEWMLLGVVLFSWAGLALLFGIAAKHFSDEISRYLKS